MGGFQEKLRETVKNGKDSDAGKDGWAGGEGDNREGDGWMASLTQCT